MKVQELSAPSSAMLAKRRSAYAEFEQINGEHSFKIAVPDGTVEYQVRTRHGGQVVFFNFPLAREMGLIPEDHPDKMNQKLELKLLETFSLVIINEYDIQRKTKFPAKDIRPNRYMATRYLQLQHPNKQGKTSGDGRGIWNGEFKGREGITWDVTSSGTGATCLSPAAAQSGKHFRTGDKRVGYGNGYNTLDEGFSAALMSEIFHQNGIGTERTLLIIGFSGADAGTSINVRVGRNLMRPSHIFCYLKQNKLEALKSAIDYYYQRQSQNRLWPKELRGERRYRFFTDEMARAFAKAAARFESEYIFCWLDWDGDNILADGGIIDYGSVRQFGLYYGDYRYDDVQRYSTRLPEQRLKARYIVQCFAQIRDFLIKGRKENIRKFRNDPALSLFELEYEKTYLEFLLEKVGFSAKDQKTLMTQHPEEVRAFKKVVNYFERIRSLKGEYAVPDGLNRDAVFCIRDLLREYPKLLHHAGDKRTVKTATPLEIVKLMAIQTADPKDLIISSFREKRLIEFATLYTRLITRLTGDPVDSPRSQRLILEMIMRSSVINKQDRITGDAAIFVTENLIRWHKRVPREILHEVFRELVSHQHFRPIEGISNQSIKRATLETFSRWRSGKGKLHSKNLKLIRKHRNGL